MKVLLDTNVVLDVILKRSPWQADAEAIWAAHEAGELEACLTASVLTDVFYIVRRFQGNASARLAVEECVGSLQILTVDYALAQHALSLPMNDFEDAIQVAAAMRHHLDAIVTRDVNDFAGASVPAIEPGDLLLQLDSAGN